MSVNDSVLELQGEFRVNNLFKLAQYLLRARVDDFDMGHYRRYRGERIHYPNRCLVAVPTDPECDTVGCAVGHGPDAGISGLPNEDWNAYAERVFVTDGTAAGSRFGYFSPWEWCFDSQWVDSDNTAEGAGLRILYYLKYGEPVRDPRRRDGEILSTFYRDHANELWEFAAANGFSIV